MGPRALGRPADPPGKGIVPGAQEDVAISYPRGDGVEGFRLQCSQDIVVDRHHVFQGEATGGKRGPGTVGSARDATLRWRPLCPRERGSHRTAWPNGMPGRFLFGFFLRKTKCPN